MRLFNALAIVTTLGSVAVLSPRQAAADRVCRQDCVGPVCEERCREVRDRYYYDDRYDRDARRERREYRSEHGVRVPGVGRVEIDR